MARTLSANESRVVLELQWLEQSTVTLEQIHEILGGERSYARFVAHRLVHKGWLERLRPGSYKLIPANRGPEGIGDTNPFRIEPTLDFPHFFSFGTACNHYAFTEQLFAEYYVAARPQRASMTINGVRYVFPLVREDRFFGFEEVKVFGQALPMALPSRALLDALDRPRYAGGIGEVSLMVRNAGRRGLPWDQLVEFLGRWNCSALAQRLGYLLEFHAVSMPKGILDDIRGQVRPKNVVYLGGRARWGSKGSFDCRWSLVENVPRNVLVDRTKEGGRRA